MTGHVNERPRRHSNRAIAVVLIAVGALILINQAGIFGAAVWDVLWPTLLIAFGLDLMTGGTQRRRIGTGSLLLLVMLTPLMLGAHWIDPQEPVDQPDHQRIALNDVDRIRANVTLTAGELSVNSLPGDSPDIVEIDGQAEVRTQTVNDRVGVIEIGPDSQIGAGDLALSVTPNLPLDLAVTVSAGSAETLDFSGTQLEKLDLNVVAGSTQLVLPEQGVIDVTISTSMGEIDVEVPDDLPARLEINDHMGETEIDDRFQSVGNGVYLSEGYSDTAPNRAIIRIRAGAGEVNVD